MEGISRREAARRAGIDESTVRRALDSGALAKALLADGSLEPVKALKALAENVQRGKSVPMALTSAKSRRLRAQVEKLNDEVARMRRTTIGVDAVGRFLSEQRAIVENSFAALPWDAGTEAAGKSAAVAHLALRGLVIKALERTVADDADNDDDDDDDDGGNDDPNDRSPAHMVEPQIDLGAMSPNDLTARRISLQAEKLEIQTALERGEARLVPDAIADFEARLGVAKSLFMALPDRLAQTAEASTADELEALVATELESAFAEI